MMAETPLRRNVASAEVRSGIYRSGVLEAHVDRHDIQSLVLVAEGAKPVGHIRTYTGEAVEQLFKDLGLEYVSLKSGDGNKRSYYISRSRNLIERALVLSLSDDSDAVEAGALLGYEPCCVKAYAAKDSMGRNLHTVMLYERMESEMRLAGTDSNLLNIFTLNTYIPCSGSCEASIAHARTNKKLLDEVYPGLTQRMLNHEMEEYLTMFKAVPTRKRIAEAASAMLRARHGLYGGPMNKSGEQIGAVSLDGNVVEARV